MKRFAFAALMVLGGCGGKSSLSGSVSQVYALDFQTVAGSYDDSVKVLTVSYFKGADANSGYTMKVVVDLAGLTITPGQAVDLTQLSADSQPRGSFEQILSTNDVQLPFSVASITFDEGPVVGKELSGKFAATFTDPTGHALQGTFDVAKLAAVAR